MGDEERPRFAYFFELVHIAEAATQGKHSVKAISNALEGAGAKRLKRIRTEAKNRGSKTWVWALRETDGAGPDEEKLRAEIGTHKGDYGITW